MIIMEIKDKEKVSEYAEKILRYAGKLMQMIDGGDEEADGYGERYDRDDRMMRDGRMYGERMYGGRRYR